jgi:hypothetical protein
MAWFLVWKVGPAGTTSVKADLQVLALASTEASASIEMLITASAEVARMW